MNKKSKQMSQDQQLSDRFKERDSDRHQIYRKLSEQSGNVTEEDVQAEIIRLKPNS
jgi:hypothetical protein